MGSDIAPSVYYPELSHYIPRYVVLAFAIGFGISAVRSGHRFNRLIGIAVIVAGGWLVWHIVDGCLKYF